MTKIAMVKPWPIEIDGLPNLQMGGFSMAMLNNQMVLKVHALDTNIITMSTETLWYFLIHKSYIIHLITTTF